MLFPPEHPLELPQRALEMTRDLLSEMMAHAVATRSRRCEGKTLEVNSDVEGKDPKRAP